uniref:hypothetical protein n=1 Tax=Gemmiger formicilis TaxID=745368 RepID=UPI004025DE40
MTKSVEHKVSFPSYNLSVCSADSSPGRGASGEEARLHEMPKPPLGRATTTTAAGGGNREELLGLRSAIRKQSEADAGYRNPDNGTASAVTERLFLRLLHIVQERLYLIDLVLRYGAARLV